MFAVTTGLPSLSAASTTCRAVVVPPINSTIRSTSGSATTLRQSAVINPAGKLTARAFFKSRTATRRTLSDTPRRDAINAPLRWTA